MEQLTFLVFQNMITQIKMVMIAIIYFKEFHPLLMFFKAAMMSSIFSRTVGSTASSILQEIMRDL